MRVLFHALLLIAVLIGLATQGVARAAESCPMEHAQSSVMTGMEDCCPEDEPKNHDGGPCNEMSLACLAMTSCATLGALDFHAGTGLVSQGLGALKFWTLAASLHGRTIPPETHPPARLG